MKLTTGKVDLRRLKSRFS